MFSTADPAHMALTEDAIRNEMENGKLLRRVSILAVGICNVKCDVCILDGSL